VAFTSLAFSAQGVTDPEGDPITYKWDFGDGTTATGSLVTKIYAVAGTYTVKLTANDGHNPDVAAAQAGVIVRSTTRLWVGTLTCSTCVSRPNRNVALSMTQTGQTLSGGTCTDSSFGVNSLLFNPAVTAIDPVTGRLVLQAACVTILLNMEYDPAVDRFVKVVWDPGPFGYTGILTRQ
jgi:hypothetical protein